MAVRLFFGGGASERASRHNEDETNLINFTVSLTAASEFVRGGGGSRGLGVHGAGVWWAARSVRLLTALIAATHGLSVRKAKSGTVGAIFFVPLLLGLN